MFAVRCEGPVESEPNGSFDEAWNNPDHPVLYPNVGLVSGYLNEEDTRDDWWIMASDTPIMRMRESDIAKLKSPLSQDTYKGSVCNFIIHNCCHFRGDVYDYPRPPPHNNN